MRWKAVALKYKRLLIMIIFIIPFSIIPMPITGGTFSDFQFLIADGTMQYRGFDYYRSESASDINGIEWVINISSTESIVVTSLSDTVVKFKKDYTVTVTSAYQKRSSIQYNPTHYGLKFYDDTYNELGSENTSTLTFSLIRQVNKETGERILAQNPYGATHIAGVAYYDNLAVYSSTAFIFYSFGDVGSNTNVFNVNATTWTIGKVVEENFTVSGDASYQDFSTWVLERNNIPAGYAQYSYKIEYEKTSGIVVKVTGTGTETDVAHFQWKSWLENLVEILDDGYPQVSAPQGQNVSSLDPITITFIGEEKNFDHYNLYRNGSLFETGQVYKTTWNFTLSPTAGNTTWTFEIVDKLGYSANATTWLLYQSSASLSTPGFTSFILPFAFFTLLIIFYPLRKRKKPNRRETSFSNRAA